MEDLLLLKDMKCLMGRIDRTHMWCPRRDNVTELKLGGTFVAPPSHTLHDSEPLQRETFLILRRRPLYLVFYFISMFVSFFFFYYTFILLLYFSYWFIWPLAYISSRRTLWFMYRRLYKHKTIHTKMKKTNDHVYKKTTITTTSNTMQRAF